MSYSPIDNMIRGNTVAPVDPIQIQKDQAQIDAYNREEEERKRLEAEQKAQEAEAANQAKQAQEKAAKDQANSPVALTQKALGYVRDKAMSPVLGVSKEELTAVVGGVSDFIEGVGERYDIPFLRNLPAPENVTEYGKASRKVAEALIPIVVATKLGNKAATALGGRFGLNLNGWQNFGARSLLNAGIGVAVDDMSKLAEDDNLGGSLKKAFPQQFNWIPDSWATTDADSPDLKRTKNKFEGMGLGFVGDIAEGLSSLSRIAKGKAPTYQFIPKDDAATAFRNNAASKDVDFFSDNPVIDAIARNAKSREDAVDSTAIARFNRQESDDYDAFINSPLSETNELLPKAVKPNAAFEAMVDNSRIKRNIGTVDGRMANFMTDAAVENLDMTDLAGRTMIRSMEDDIIKGSGNFEVKLPDGRMLTKKQIMEDADVLLKDVLLNPAMTSDKIDEVFESMRNFESVMNLKPINDVAYKASFKAVKELQRFYVGMDTARASAYVQASLAGEAADLASASRLVGDELDMQRAQELIFDKMKLLWYELDMSSSVAGWSLNNKKVWSDAIKNGDSNRIKELADQDVRSFKQKASDTASKAMAFSETLKQIKNENPSYLLPLLHAYELTDGHVDSIRKLNIFMNNSLGVLRKGIVDGNPEMPSLVVQGLWGVAYNNILSATLTAMKAASGNLAQLFMRPANVLLGAALRGDGKTLHRGWVQYATHMDTFTKSFGHMNRIFKMASENPDSVRIYEKGDLSRANDQLMATARLFAEAEAEAGNYGPMFRYNTAKLLRDVGNHPWFRYSTNAMEAFDGFVKSAVGMAEARGRAFDQILESGKRITEEDVKRVSQEIYSQMFDENGLITDKAVDYASREISLALDGPINDSLNNVLRRVPILRTLMMFPRTSMNAITIAGKYSPLSVDLWKVQNAQTVEEMTEFLAAKGIPYSQQAFDTMKSEIVGRAAMGTMFAGYGAWMALSGNLTGNGVYDKQTQKYSRNVGGKPFRSWRVPGTDKWISYDGIEPIATFLSLSADIITIGQSLGTATQEDLLKKLGFAFAQNFTNKSFLSGLQPLTEILSGNEASASKWAANTVGMAIPYSSLLSQMSRLMLPGLREVDLEFTQLLQNKQNFAAEVLGAKPLPYQADFTNGEKVGFNDPLENAFNNFLPFKTTSSPSEVKQFLIDVEYDVMPRLKSSSRGVEYTPEQRRDLSEFMGNYGKEGKGKQSFIEKSIIKLSKDRKALAEIEFIRQQRQQGVSQNQLDLSTSYVHQQLDRIFQRAFKAGEQDLRMKYPDIKQQERALVGMKRAQRRGDFAQQVQAISEINK